MPDKTPPLTLDQFAALEAWMEGFLRMLNGEQSAGPGRAERATYAYNARQRAMFALTGVAGPPAAVTNMAEAVAATSEPDAPVDDDDLW